jgi:hypothetical protein
LEPRKYGKTFTASITIPGNDATDSIEKKNNDITLEIPTTKKGISRAAKVWEEHAHLHPFLEHWSKAQELAKLAQFFSQFQDPIDLQALARAASTGTRELVAALNLKDVEEGGLGTRDLSRLIAKRQKHLQAAGIDPAQLAAAIAQQTDSHCWPNTAKKRPRDLVAPASRI